MNRTLPLLLSLALATPLWTGCTAVLWEKSTFATYHHVADPINLQVYHSDDRNDLLVQYDESCNRETAASTRYYWVQPNQVLTESGKKPMFDENVSLVGLALLPQASSSANPVSTGLHGLYIVRRAGDLRFSLYSGPREMESCILPDYDTDQKTGLKVLLTPPAVVADASLIGIVFAIVFSYLFQSSAHLH
jgi:hypothetical protein